MLSLLRFLVLAVLLASPSALAQDKDQTAPPAEATFVTWQENGRTMRAWTAFDEMAVFRGRDRTDGRRFTQQMRGLAPERDILFMNDFVSMIRTQKLEASLFASPRGMDEAARRAPGAPRRKAGPVFYSSGRRDAGRMALTGEVTAFFEKEPTPAQVAKVEKDFGLTLARSVTPQALVFEAETPWAALQAANLLHDSGLVREATPGWLKSKATRLTSDPLSSQQWHLANTGQGGGTPGADANVSPAWEFVVGDAGQVIAIVDSGVEIGHEDLQPNVQPGLSWDYVLDLADPSGDPSEAHGTACAGVAAARGGNSLGVTGVAPRAGLAGIRLLGAETDLNESLAFSRNSTRISVYSNSWGPLDDGRRLQGPGPLALEAIRNATQEGRGGKGSIFVWAGGNGLQNLDNSNYDGYANLRQALAVSASTDRGEQAPYSEPGANILVNAPSNGGASGITTTDRTGAPGYSATSYTSNFGGTSAAAPQVAGVAALMLQANADLSWRDVRWILARTAVRNDPAHPDWTVNGAGLPVNHAHGFGRVDTLAAVTMSADFPGLGPERVARAQAKPGLAIPDNDPVGVSSTLHIGENFTVEFVDVTFSAPDHPYWGDLEIVLTSPAGTRSVLAQRHPSGRGTAFYDNWRFGSTRHLGESSAGQWTLAVRDRWGQDTGTFGEWKLEIFGHDSAGAPRRVDMTPVLHLLLGE